MDPFSALNNDLEEYIKEHTSAEDEVLYELNRYTHLTQFHPRMISGQVQGKFIEMICKMLSPKNALEIGTFTGYTTICMARGIGDNGHVHTIEVNDEITDTTLSFFKKAGVENKITLHIGNAIDLIPRFDILFDLVIIDGDKREYPQYLNCVLPKVNDGGIIIADNVLWGGKVIDCNANDPFTQGVRDFNQMVSKIQNLEKVLLPLRDGLMIIRKLKQ